MRRAVLLLLLLAWPAEAQEIDVTETLVNPFYYCVGRAVSRQPDRYRNPEEAVERGFMACQTEEMAIRSYAEMNRLSPAQISMIVTTHRTRLKARLVEGLLQGPQPTPKKAAK